MTDKSLAIYDEKEKELLASLGNELSVAGEENLEHGDVGMPPRLRISQPNRPVEVAGEETEPGVIVNTVTGEYWQDVPIVPIVFLPKTRVMWPETYSADNAPECLSDDGKVPSTERDVTNPQPGPCALCRMSQFGDNNEKPRCTEQRNFLVWLAETGEPAILTMQSTALKEARKLTMLAKMQGVRKSVLFSTMKVKDDRGSWYVPIFSRGDALPVADILELVEKKNELQNLIVVADTADEMQEPVGAFDYAPMEEDEVPF